MLFNFFAETIPIFKPNSELLAVLKKRICEILVRIRIPGSVPLARVVDPYSFFPDPDPEFDFRDQYGSGSGSNTDPGL
jgi:hypothetical protein